MGNRFKVGGKTYDIPEDRTDAFLNDMQSRGAQVQGVDEPEDPNVPEEPEAATSVASSSPSMSTRFTAGGKTYDIPDDKRDAFISDMQSRGIDPRLEGSDPRGVVELPEVQIQGHADPWWVRGMRGAGLVQGGDMPSLAKQSQDYSANMQNMVDQPGQTAAREVASLAAPLAGGPSGGMLSGALRGGVQAFGQAYADTGDLPQSIATGGAGMVTGGLAPVVSAAARGAGDVGQGLEGVADDIAASPMTKRAGQLAGGFVGGKAAGYLGGMVGASLGGGALPAAVGAAGDVMGATGGAIANTLGDPAVSAFAGQQIAARQQALTSALAPQRETPQRESPQQATQKATGAGRGNLLGDAALDALRNDPSVLGEYQGEFAKAASSSESGAVNALITRLAARDPKFRTGPMLELQRMTAVGPEE